MILWSSPDQSKSLNKQLHEPVAVILQAVLRLNGVSPRNESFRLLVRLVRCLLKALIHLSFFIESEHKIIKNNWESDIFTKIFLKKRQLNIFLAVAYMYLLFSNIIIVVRVYFYTREYMNYILITYWSRIDHVSNVCIDQSFLYKHRANIIRMKINFISIRYFIYFKGVSLQVFHGTECFTYMYVCWYLVLLYLEVYFLYLQVLEL